MSTRTSEARSAFKCFLMTNWSKQIGDPPTGRTTSSSCRSREIRVLDDEASRDRAMYIALMTRQADRIRRYARQPFRRHDAAPRPRLWAFANYAPGGPDPGGVTRGANYAPGGSDRVP